MDQPYEFKEDTPLRLNYTNSTPIRGPSSPASEHRPDSARSGTSQNAMLDIKNTRKRTEADLQMLANRIALLRVCEQYFIKLPFSSCIQHIFADGGRKGKN